MRVVEIVACRSGVGDPLRERLAPAVPAQPAPRHSQIRWRGPPTPELPWASLEDETPQFEITVA